MYGYPQVGNLEKGPGYGYGYGYGYYQQRYYRSGQDTKNEVPKDDNYGVFQFLSALEIQMQAMKSPDGSQAFPGKTCRDLKSCFTELKNGEYFVDPNMGCVNDAFKVYCNFTSGETCLYPKRTMYEKKKWVDSGKDGFRWMMEELAQEKVDYIADEIQFRHLRMNSMKVRQNITYHCRNSHAFKDAQGKEKTFVKFMSEDNVEMYNSAHFKNQPKVLFDGCNVKDGKWHKTVFEVESKATSRLPVTDIAVFDVAEQGEEFGIELGPVCFS